MFTSSVARHCTFNFTKCIIFSKLGTASLRQLRPAHQPLSSTRFTRTHGIHRGSIRPYSQSNRSPEICLREQFTVNCRRVPAWCINILPNMPIHHRAARGIRGVFWLNLRPAMMRGMLGFCCRKVQIQRFVKSSFHRRRRGEGKMEHRCGRHREGARCFAVGLSAALLDHVLLSPRLYPTKWTYGYFIIHCSLLPWS